jgi:poly(A) polymerase Pap1
MQTSQNKKIILKSLLILITLTFASLATIPLPEFKFKLDLEKPLTDTLGVAVPALVAGSQVGDNIIIFRPDKVCYKGRVTSIEETSDTLKVYGDVYDKEGGTSFGFVMAKGGVFAGAIVDKKNNRVYVLEFSPEHKGYIFKESLVHRKPEA